MKKYIGVGYFLVLLFPTIISAQSCDMTGAQNFTCSKTQFTTLQSEMRKKYQELKQRLSGNQKKRLQYSQLSWMNQRDISCRQGLEQATSISCHINALEKRNDWLDVQILKCKEQECQTIAFDR